MKKGKRRFFFLLAVCAVLIALLFIGIKKTFLHGEDFSAWLQYEAYKKKEFLEKAQAPLDKKILIVTFNLGDYGAPLMFLYLTQALHQKGYNVFLLTYDGGRHEKDLKKAHIPYLVSKEFYEVSEETENFFSLFDIVISGRIPQIYIPSQEYKFIWWDHGLLDCVPLFFFQGNRLKNDDPLKNIKFMIFEAKDVVFVSELQQKKLAKCRQFSSEVIHNGINPTETNMNDPVIRQIQAAKSEGKTVFVTIGYVAPIKGQDILVKAVSLLPEKYCKKAAFYVIGSVHDEKYAKDLREESEDIPEIVWAGPVVHEKIGGVYESADVLLVPSRSDTSPLVVQEAAEHYMPSVITDNVGSTYIIQNGKSGFIIPREDPKSLAEKIKFFIDNPDKIKEYGILGRQNYDKHSSFDVFEKKWEDKINRKFKEVKKKK